MKYYISKTHHSLHDSATIWQPCEAKTLQGAKRKALQRGSYLDHAVHVGVEFGREDENGAKEITTIATRPDCRRGTKWQNLN